MAEVAVEPSAPPGWRGRLAAPSLVLVLALSALVFAGGFLLKEPCRRVAFGSGDTQYRLGCYTDIPLLYVFRGFSDGQVAYLDHPAAGGRYLEYPVLTGAVIQAAVWLTGDHGSVAERMVRFYDITAVMLLGFALVMVAAVWAVRPRGPTAALMVALSPALLLTATINWDLVAVAFTALAVLAWSRDRPFVTGLMVGLGAAAKFYPALLLGPLLVLTLHRAWRQRDDRTGTGPWRSLLLALLGTAVAWMAVNLPVALANRDGWAEFYTFSRQRGIDFGSPWLAVSYLGWRDIPTESVNTVTAGAFLLLCVGIGVLGLMARRPTFAQLAFLVVAAFAVTNKVYSPQYVLWMLPLAALARPRWGLFLLWQAGEVVYFFGVWRLLLGYGNDQVPGSITTTQYAWTILLHVGLTTVLALAVAYDLVRGRPGADGPPVSRTR